MVFKNTFGIPENFVPSAIKRKSKIKIAENGLKFGNVGFNVTRRGVQLSIKFKSKQEIFGFGLQMKGFNRNYGKVKTRNDADPVGNSGNTHASVPLFFTAEGRGYIIDTFRDTTFYIGKSKKRKRTIEKDNKITLSTEELYFGDRTDSYDVNVEIPYCEGVTVYYIETDSLTQAVKEYNMLSGGGCLPPIWGLGVYYRCSAKFCDRQVLDTADYFRRNDIPLSVIGLEPGWQTHSYSCSLVWDKKRFPNPNKFIEKLNEKNCKVNLWEHAFISPAAPFYDEIFPYCGNYEVWQGVVPDFTSEQCVKPFINRHKELVKQGVTGFKLDECDGSDNTGGWFFPDNAEFPSGIDGEQMHNAFGILYQKTIMRALNKPTFSQARSTHLFCAPLPFALYSDLYEMKDYVTACVNSGFSGMLWSPELRDCKDKKDLLNRMRLLVFSAQYIINAWYLERAPWLEFGAEQEAKEILKLRESLIPYLFSAYNVYNKTGLPPIRAVVVDYPMDKETYSLQDEYMFGESLLVAPVFDGGNKRKVYLPKGAWYDFYSAKRVNDGYTDYESDNMPVFVKGNSVIPFARKISGSDNDVLFEIEPVCYGEGGTFTLADANGKTFDLIMTEGVLENTEITVGNYKIISGKNS